MPDDRGDVHATFAAHRAAGKVDPGEPLQQHGDRFRLCGRRRWLAEEGPAPSQGTLTRAIGEQTKVANTHEATRHDVQEKASQEFVSLECQDLHAVMLICEGHNRRQVTMTTATRFPLGRILATPGALAALKTA